MTMPRGGRCCCCSLIYTAVERRCNGAPCRYNGCNGLGPGHDVSVLGILFFYFIFFNYCETVVVVFGVDNDMILEHHHRGVLLDPFAFWNAISVKMIASLRDKRKRERTTVPNKKCVSCRNEKLLFPRTNGRNSQSRSSHLGSALFGFGRSDKKNCGSPGAPEFGRTKRWSVIDRP